MKNIIFVAPPAAGKGTYSSVLEKKFNYVHISTGDLLRDARKREDELGKKITLLMDSGKLVTDDIVLELLKQKLESLDSNDRIILDGFPRNVNQAKVLDDMFNSLGMIDYEVIYLEIDKESALKRTLGRLVCPKCKSSYNEFNEEMKPKVDNTCDNCGTLLEKRSDDTKETFEIRFDTYMSETKPVLDYYEEKGKLHSVSSLDGIETVLKNLEGVING